MSVYPLQLLQRYFSYYIILCIKYYLYSRTCMNSHLPRKVTLIKPQNTHLSCIGIHSNLPNTATCLLQPKKRGPIGDHIRQVPLYIIHTYVHSMYVHVWVSRISIYCGYDLILPFDHRETKYCPTCLVSTLKGTH